MRLPCPAHQADSGVAACGHHLGNAAAPHLGSILIARHIADPMDPVLDLPMLTDHAQPSLRTRPFRAKTGNPVDHLVALRPARLPGHVALPWEHLRQPGPVTLPSQARAGGQAALLDAAVPAVHRLRGSPRLRQGVGLLEEQADILLQLRLVALDEHHLVAATRYDVLCDGMLCEHGIHGDDPSLQD